MDTYMQKGRKVGRKKERKKGRKKLDYIKI